MLVRSGAMRNSQFFRRAVRSSGPSFMGRPSVGGTPPGLVGGRAEAPAGGPAGGAIAGPSGCAGGACLVKRPSSRIETSDGIQIGTRIIRRGAGSRPVGFDYPQFIFFYRRRIR